MEAERAVLPLLASGEDHGHAEHGRGPGEPDHVGLDLLARWNLHDVLEYTRLMVDQQERSGGWGKRFRCHDLPP